MALIRFSLPQACNTAGWLVKFPRVFPKAARQTDNSATGAFLFARNGYNTPFPLTEGPAPCAGERCVYGDNSLGPGRRKEKTFLSYRGGGFAQSPRWQAYRTPGLLQPHSDRQRAATKPGAGAGRLLVVPRGPDFRPRRQVAQGASREPSQSRLIFCALPRRRLRPRRRQGPQSRTSGSSLAS